MRTAARSSRPRAAARRLGRRRRLTVDGTASSPVETGARPRPATSRRGVALARHAEPAQPRLPARAWPGSPSGAAPAGDSFWTWREVMYRFARRAHARRRRGHRGPAYVEMLEARLHRASASSTTCTTTATAAPMPTWPRWPGGSPPRPSATGIGLTLLPVLYAHGGFGGAARRRASAASSTIATRFARLLEAHAGARCAGLPRRGGRHRAASLRAVDAGRARARVARRCAGDGPIHIHVAEQTQEVEDCLAWSGARPVEWLLDDMPVDRRWCLIHATHMTAGGDLAPGALAAPSPACARSPRPTSATASSTRAASWRPGGALRHRHGQQRRDQRRRGAAPARVRPAPARPRAQRPGATPGSLDRAGALDAALAAARRRSARPIGALAPGRRADLVVLDAGHPDLAGRTRATAGSTPMCSRPAAAQSTASMSRARSWSRPAGIAPARRSRPAMSTSSGGSA